MELQRKGRKVRAEGTGIHDVAENKNETKDSQSKNYKTDHLD